MKHFNELTDIETVSIDLEVLQSTVRVLTYGMPEANRTDIEQAMHNITEQLNSINIKLREAFNELFYAIKEESELETKGRKSAARKNKV